MPPLQRHRRVPLVGPAATSDNPEATLAQIASAKGFLDERLRDTTAPVDRAELDALVTLLHGEHLAHDGSGGMGAIRRTTETATTNDSRRTGAGRPIGIEHVQPLDSVIHRALERLIAHARATLPPGNESAR